MIIHMEKRSWAFRIGKFISWTKWSKNPEDHKKKSNKKNNKIYRNVSAMRKEVLGAAEIKKYIDKQQKYWCTDQTVWRTDLSVALLFANT